MPIFPKREEITIEEYYKVFDSYKNVFNSDLIYAIYSKDDHIVPYEILKLFSIEIEAIPISIDGIGHMGKKSGLVKLLEVINLIINN